MAHNCDGLVVSCIDFRFQKYIRTWLEDTMKNKTFDYVGYAGSVKDLDTIMGQLEISKRLHNINEVYLINHEDCGAYRELGTPEKHREDLLKAKTAILEKYPDLMVNLYYLHLDGTFEQIQ